MEQSRLLELVFAVNEDGVSYSVTGVGEHAGKDIVIPDTYNGHPVTAIGVKAFSGCAGLTSVTIGSGVTEIATSAFSYCTGLATIRVAEGNTTYYSAGNCIIETETKTLVLGCKNSAIPTDGSVTAIGFAAFYGCVGLTSIEIPDSVTSIDDDAFYACTGLTSVTIGSGVTSIGDCAFYDCFKLVEVKNLSRLPIEVGGCDISMVDLYALRVYREGKSALSTTSDGFTLYKEGPDVVLVSYGGEETDVTIPSVVTAIGSGAFCECASLTSVTIGDGVTCIGDNAFYFCENLVSVAIGSGVKSIGEEAFYGCTHLKTVFINTTGWYCTTYSTTNSDTPVDLSDPGTTATYLTSTYAHYEFKRNA